MKPFLVGLALRRAARQVRGADDDDVLRDDRRRVQADLAGDRIDRLIVLQLQIDDAVLAEAGRGHAGLGVERDHLVARRHVDDARAARPSVQYDEAASGELPRRRFAALAFVLAVHPQQSRRCRRRAPRPRGACRPWSRRRRPTISGVASKVELGARAERVGLEPPRDLELVEVVL